ncbi:type IV secretion system protein [Brucella endophytica]|uniref:type IV secretion system protein n=1 Tax=Brucella endophytica TaxID=1963359 RepID=UPI0016658F29|nr:type IV secretion system protein [Brucella endophytica]
MRNLKKSALSVAVLAISAVPGVAQVPTYDSAVHKETIQTTKNTQTILESNDLIKQQTKSILEAVTGNRQDGSSFANAALGGGFSFGQAPTFSDVLAGGSMNWGNLGGDFQKLASTLINGMKLVKSLSGKEGMAKSSSNQAGYESALNMATSLAGIVSGSQAAVANRTSQFQNAGGQIGQSKDIKGSIDMNTQMQLQTAQTTNEAIGAVTALGAAEQSKLMKQLAEESGTADLLNY